MDSFGRKFINVGRNRDWSAIALPLMLKTRRFYEAMSLLIDPERQNAFAIPCWLTMNGWTWWFEYSYLTNSKPEIMRSRRSWTTWCNTSRFPSCSRFLTTRISLDPRFRALRSKLASKPDIWRIWLQLKSKIYTVRYNGPRKSIQLAYLKSRKSFKCPFFNLADVITWEVQYCQVWHISLWHFGSWLQYPHGWTTHPS